MQLSHLKTRGTGLTADPSATGMERHMAGMQAVHDKLQRRSSASDLRTAAQGTFTVAPDK
jgi:hypothetical protein